MTKISDILVALDECNAEMDTLVTMCGNNVAAYKVCIALSRSEALSNTKNHFGAFKNGFRSLVLLDDLGIYEDRIPKLWEVCGKDTDKMLAVIIAFQSKKFGRAHRQVLNYAIDHNGGGVDMPTFVKNVDEHIPDFHP